MSFVKETHNYGHNKCIKINGSFENFNEYCNLCKYINKSYNNNITGIIERNSSQPTLCMSLSHCGDDFFNNDYSNFLEKYFPTQIRCILCFKSLFPNGRIRLYFDNLMLKNIEQNNVNFTIANFYNYEYDNEQHGILAKVFEEYIKESKTISGNFINHYLLASRLIVENINNFNFNDFDSIDIFSYEFLKHPFIEYYDQITGKNSNVPTSFDPFGINDSKTEYIKVTYETEYKCHITKGMIVQHMRYIILGTIPYQDKDKHIYPPNHIIWRDGHTNSIGKYDSEWINNFKKYCKENDLTKFLLPKSNYYEQYWNGKIQCNTNKYFKSPIAGQIQFYSSLYPVTELIANEIYFETVGLPFIVHNDTLPFEKERNNFIKLNVEGKESKKKYFSYGYGIDEFTLTNLFNNDYIKSISLYFNFVFLSNIIQKTCDYRIGHLKNINPLFIVFNLLSIIHNICKSSVFDTQIVMKDLLEFNEKLKANPDEYVNMFIDNAVRAKIYPEIKDIENIRDILKSIILKLLDIFPTKYNIVETNYLISSNDNIFDNNFSLNSKKLYLNVFMKDLYLLLPSANVSNVGNINLMCKNIISNCLTGAIFINTYYPYYNSYSCNTICDKDNMEKMNENNIILKNPNKDFSNLNMNMNIIKKKYLKYKFKYYNEISKNINPGQQFIHGKEFIDKLSENANFEQQFIHSKEIIDKTQKNITQSIFNSNLDNSNKYNKTYWLSMQKQVNNLYDNINAALKPKKTIAELNEYFYETDDIGTIKSLLDSIKEIVDNNAIRPFEFF